MPGPPYPAHWEADVVLADGGTAHIRPVVPADADRLVSLHSRLSASTVRYRFFTAHPRLSSREVEWFTVVDHVDRVALLALLGDDMIAVARYDRTGPPDEAEVAFVVEDSHQGRGLGTILLEHLAAAARERGVRRFVAETLPDNRRMIGVFRDAGWATSTRFADGVVHVTVDLETTEGALAAQEERERRAEARSVARLLEPASIAVVGAGADEAGIGTRLLRNLQRGGFTGALHPVHRTARVVAGLYAVPRVSEIDDEVDLAVVAVPAAAVPGVVADCAAKRVRGLLVVSAGFADAGPAGAAAERALVAAARGGGMRVVGPNSMGMINTDPAVSMDASLSEERPLRGRVAVSSQSGALGIALLEWSARLGLGVSSMVAVGNKADVSSNDLLQYWQDDPSTDVVLLYLESFGNPRKFARVARRLGRTKPVVAVKSGRRDGDGVVDALFSQAGVIRVDSLEQLFDTAAVLARAPLPTGRRVAIVASTSGPGLLAADACLGAGLQLAELGPATGEALAAARPAVTRVANPVDLAAEAAPEQYARAVEVVVEDEGVDAVMLVFAPPGRRPVDEVGRAVDEAARRTATPVVAVYLAADGGLRAVGPLPTVRSPEAAALALVRAAEYAEWRQAPLGAEVDPPGADVVAARLLVDAALAELPAGGDLGLEDAVQLLGHVGIPVVPTVTAVSPEGAEAAADAVEGPVAVRRAYAALAAASGGPPFGVTVQPAVLPEVELVVGVVLDPSFGPLVTLAAGGPLADLLDDRTARITPLTDVDAATQAGDLRLASRLAPGARAALEDLLLRVSRLVEEVPEVAELALDPVVVNGDRVAVAGARVRLVPDEPRPELALRRLS